MLIGVQLLCRFDRSADECPRALRSQSLKAAKCPADKLRIYNSPRNMLFVARYLACTHAETPYCFFQDDDWLVQPLRALYSQFSRDPEGPVLVHTNPGVATLYGLEWCFFREWPHLRLL